MPSRPAFIITTLAEYQTLFWVKVARALSDKGIDPHFISFDDRSSEMIAEAGFPVVSANGAEQVSADEIGGIFARVGLDRLSFWTSHERLTFGRTDTEAMHEKLARSILCAERAIEVARRNHSEIIMLQEVGGFLSVIGSYFGARASGIDNWFIEPSFFRGRMMLRRNTFAAARVESSDCPSDENLKTYLDQTLRNSSIVIPKKDAHLYRSALTKVMNKKNLARLTEKVRDKYFLGKKQEFGYIGRQIAVHLRMIGNSRRLKSHYTKLEGLGPFVYYPLHVPGDMALTFRSPEYLDQIALIDFLSRMLPDGYKLALKEHPAMVGAVPARALRDLLKRYDNIVLLTPTTNSYAVMGKASCIVTVNSKSGAEAGLLGKPVLVLGDAFYRHAPFAIPVDRLRDLPEALQAALTGIPRNMRAPAHEEWFACLWEQSLPGDLYVNDAAAVDEFARSLLSLSQQASINGAPVPA